MLPQSSFNIVSRKTRNGDEIGDCLWYSARSATFCLGPMSGITWQKWQHFPGCAARRTDLLSQDKAVGGGVAEPRVQRVELVGGAGHICAAAQAVDLDEVLGQRGDLFLLGARARLGRAEVEAPLRGILQLRAAKDMLSACMQLAVDSRSAWLLMLLTWMGCISDTGTKQVWVAGL